MCSSASNKEIITYLNEVKTLIYNGDYQFIPRSKNLQSLSMLGLTIEDAKSYIYDLQINDYYKGPKADFNPNFPGDIWEFKNIIMGNQVYIKLTIAENKNGKLLKILSFHIDEYQ